jgi:hypothetical protein
MGHLFSLTEAGALTCTQAPLNPARGTHSVHGIAPVLWFGDNWSWSSELANQVGTPHSAAAGSGAAVGMRERSLRGENALVWIDGLHADHEQVQDHRDLRDG